MAKLDFDKIYTDYSRLVYWAAYRVVSHRETAEDVTQTVFTKVLANKATLIKLAEPQLKSWLYRTATNLALDIVRRNKYEQPDAEPISELIADDSPSPEKVAIDRDRAERVRKAIDSLDDAYREVVMLHYFSNLTVREISECTGISEGTIKSRLVRARTLLAERLKNEVSLI
ncbi:MAG: sigma-70 family RNA polymerase sigma factor [Eubacteriales bacterium]|nr:sigma-70 family RNA polymerase sigma factor [Eubacteriales bacterium]